MLVSTEAIVINSIKYGDTSLIVKCYTKSDGLKSYLLQGVLSSKKGKVRAAYFQPLSILRLVASHNNKSSLNRIKEVSIGQSYTSIYHNVYKQSIVFFLADVLNQVLQEEEPNESLYTYLEATFLLLDTHHQTSNFHLLFLLNLTKYIGFYPEKIDLDLPYFDLKEGVFTSVLPSVEYVNNSDLELFKKLFQYNFETISNFHLSKNERGRLIEIFMKYYQLHLSGFKTPKSLEVLASIF